MLCKLHWKGEALTGEGFVLCVYISVIASSHHNNNIIIYHHFLTINRGLYIDLVTFLQHCG